MHSDFSLNNTNNSVSLGAFRFFFEQQLLLFVYSRVNNGVLYNLDYIKDIYIRALSVLVSTLDP